MTGDITSLVRVFIPYLNGLKRHCARAIVLAALPPFLGVGLLWAVKALVDDVFVGQHFDLLPQLLLLYAVFGAGKTAISYFAARVDALVTEGVALSARTRLYSHILRLSPGSMRQHNNGDLLTRLSGDVERIEVLIYSGPLGIFADVVTATVFLASLLVLSWKLTVCALFLAPSFLLVSLLSSSLIRRTARVARRQLGQWSNVAQERLNALPTIQAAASEDFEEAVFHARCDSARRAEITVAKVQAVAAAGVDLCAVLGGLAILSAGAWCVGNGEISAGGLIAFLGALGSLYGPIRSLAKTPARFQKAAASAQRVRDILSTPSLVSDAAAAIPLVRPRGHLEFNNIVFGYSPHQKVLDGVSVRIEPGETVAIVGPSGSGKSTLLKLALRLYDPQSGCIKIDGQDLRALTLSSLRGAMSVVWQEPQLFSGSIANNIAYDRQHSQALIAEAGRAASLSHVVERLRGGYEAPVGPAGRNLSGGQRQRVALARALFRDSQIILLDEATGAVDSETEQEIQSALNELYGRRSILVVAHRLSSVRRADRIIVIDNGRVVESGPPSLLLRSDSRCRALFAAQLGAEDLAA